MLECKHEWTKGPFYIGTAVTLQEPAIFPPRGSTRVEFCKKCGIMRQVRRKSYRAHPKTAALPSEYT